MAASATALGQEPPSRCAEDPAFHRLDFWLGEWDVSVGGKIVGANRITAILDGCALREEWRAVAGGRGESLFYYVPATRTWKQVWVTSDATARGGVKEKQLVEELPARGVRFRGEITLPDGGSYSDRTTLSPLPDGRVRQLIEVSGDGVNWTAIFDAIYTPASPARP